VCSVRAKLFVVDLYSRSGSRFICSTGGKPLPAIDSVISVKYFAFSQTHGSPRAIEYFRPRPDVVWEEVAKKEVPFYVSYGRTSMPSCRGCGRQIDKTELRIKTTLMFVPPGCGPLPVQINFCMNFNCINQAIKKYSQQVRLFLTFLTHFLREQIYHLLMEEFGFQRISKKALYRPFLAFIGPLLTRNTTHSHLWMTQPKCPSSDQYFIGEINRSWSYLLVSSLYYYFDRSQL
jgi:hypothetical protein